MRKRGFTIIEVVLVLAIAGLIFLMVFIALPALQRSQRNTRRRQDISRVSTAFTQYLSQNSHLPFYGKNLPELVSKYDSKFVARYIDSEITFDGTSAVNYQGVTSYKCSDGKQCSEFTDPDGSVYNFKISSGTGANSFIKNNGNFSEHLIFAVLKTKCGDGDNYVVDASGNNNFALAYILEGGAVYCVDNS